MSALTGQNAQENAGDSILGASFSNVQTTKTVTDNSQINATAQTAFAPVLSIGAGATSTLTTSDFGAVAAATTLAQNALGLSASTAADSQYTARLAILKAGDTVASQGAEALKLITTPFIIASVVVSATIAFIVYLWRRK